MIISLEFVRLGFGRVRSVFRRYEMANGYVAIILLILLLPTRFTLKSVFYVVGQTFYLPPQTGVVDTQTNGRITIISAHMDICR